MGWREKLTPSGQNYVQDIINQVPVDHGARDAFESLLDVIAKPEKVFIVVDDWGRVSKTSDEDFADHLANQDYIVIEYKDIKEIQGDNEDDCDD